MIKAAEAKGLTADSVDSVYLRGDDAILEHERRNGYDKKYSETGVQAIGANGLQDVFPDSRQVLV
jgi:hypothetical protein